MSKDQSKVKRAFRYLVFGLVLSLAAYILASWAIDNGNLIVYGLAFLAVFYSVKFYLIFIRVWFFKNDKAKSRSSRVARKTIRG